MTSPELTASLLGTLAREAREAAVGHEIRAIVDAPGGGHLLLLAERGAERISLRLLVVSERDRARIHLVPPRRPSRPAAAESAFTRDAAPALRGLILTGIDSVPGDRIVEVAAAPEPHAAHSAILVAELFGNAPNLLLLDGDRIIRAVKRRRTGQRPAARGLPHAPPPPRPTCEARAPLPSLLPPPPPGEFAERFPTSAAVDAVYHDLDLEAERSLRLRVIRAALTRSRTKLQRLRAQLQEQIDHGAQAQRQRELGDLLAAHFAALRPGLTELEIEDLYRGGTVRVPLDPRLSPRANVDACYRRARRLQRSAAGAAERLRDVHGMIENLDVLGRELDAGDLSPELSARLAEAGLTGDRPGQPAARRARQPAAAPGIRRFLLGSGLEVLVGKSNRDNDRLTFRIARGNDMWLHAHGQAGSHVVIRLPGSRTASLEDLKDAAALAVHFSKRRGAPHAEVIYTPRKYVRKHRKAPPGTVSVDRFRTLYLDDPEARARPLVSSSAG